MYDYEIRFEETKAKIEKLVEEVDNKERLKRELVSLLNKNLQTIEKLAIETIKKIKQ